MPQLDPSSFASQLFWLLTTFILLYVAMAAIALPRIGRTLENRSQTIADDLADAEALQKQAEAALAEHEAALAEARSRALTLAEEVRGQMRAETDAQKAKIEAELVAQAQAAEARLAQARTTAMGGVKAAAGEIVPDILTALGVECPDAATIRTALDTAEKEQAHA